MDGIDIIIYKVSYLKKIFQCGKSQAYALANAPGFPAISVGGKILVEHKTLEACLDKQQGKIVPLNK
jgi:hypothetical protein